MRLLLCPGLHTLILLTIFHGSAMAVDFNREIRPILSNKCFACHGPDASAREADFQLDPTGVVMHQLVEREIIIPGQPDESLLIERVRSDDPASRMPPVEAGSALTSREIELLQSWIREGAVFDQHWAFQQIVRPAVPTTNHPWVQHAIDQFVYARLQEQGIEPSPEADRPTLIRRVHLDLLGLPPPVHEVRRFRTDRSAGAYERMVDRAFASPHYGERWGRHWLDQARYADTHGYTVDSERSMWPYRDWVIRAVNEDLAFDQFSIEQLAGDLFAHPSTDQLVATGFHRNTLINQEGGTDKEQFRNEAVVDRVNTTGAVWLGLTLGCGQCHDHKFDPVTQREYYQLFAFFNSQQDANGTSPVIQLPSPEQRAWLAKLETQIRELSASTANAAESPSDRPPRSDAEVQAKLKALRDRKKAVVKSLRSSMIMKELEQPRTTHLHIRGDFLRKGAEVAPDVPAALPPLGNDGRANRLDLAKWLVSDRNPLTPRVTVNRVWSRLFGRGLVETENDFGIQGTPPTHPRLLDWLADDFMANGWSMKQLLRSILLSATYRQSSRARRELETIDPLNKRLARQARLRVDAEIVRDLGLAVSGLLDHRLGGRSVYPPQPAGVYAFTQRQAKWPTSTGADRYRRGMYTFFMRSAPYPMLTTFDTPRFNTVCTVRTRSNTPLQSLTMANGQAMLENAQALGIRAFEDSDSDIDRIEYVYELCLARPPDAHEANRLLQFVRLLRHEFDHDLGAIKEFLTDLPIETPSPSAELAACVAMARVVLNLDEFIVRE